MVVCFEEFMVEDFLSYSSTNSKDLVQESNIFLVINAIASIVNRFHIILGQPVIFALKLIPRVPMLLIVKRYYCLVADEPHERKEVPDILITGANLIVHSCLQDAIELPDSVTWRGSTIQNA